MYCTKNKKNLVNHLEVFVNFNWNFCFAHILPVKTEMSCVIGRIHLIDLVEMLFLTFLLRRYQLDSAENTTTHSRTIATNNVI